MGTAERLSEFSAAFGSGDVDAIMALMTEDVVFESTGPAPDALFTEEESFADGDRGVLRWRFSWTNDDGTQGHVRGVDVLTFRDGLVAEKLSYVKG